MHGAHFDGGNGKAQRDRFIPKFGLAGHYPINMEKERFSERYPEIEPFDMITCGEVVEHLKMAPGEMIRDLLEILAPHGTIMLTTPNGHGRRFVEASVIGLKNDDMYLRSNALLHEKGHTHVRIYTAAEIRRAIANVGGKTIMEGALDYYPELHRHWLTHRYTMAGGQLVYMIGKSDGPAARGGGGAAASDRSAAA